MTETPVDLETANAQMNPVDDELSGNMLHMHVIHRKCKNKILQGARKLL